MTWKRLDGFAAPRNSRLWWRDPRILGILLLGVASEIIYLFAFLLPFPLLRYYHSDTDMATIMAHQTSAFVLFVASFVALFAFMAIAVVLLGKVAVEKASRPSWLVPFALGSGAVFALTLVFVYPVTAIDIFNYVAEGQILVHYHANPVFVTPSQFPSQQIMVLSGGWSKSSAPYGPLGILFDSWPAVIAGANLLVNLLLLKFSFAALVLVEAVLVYRILDRVAPALAPAGVLLIAWNPLLLFEMAANGHNDILMLVLATAGVALLVEDRQVTGFVVIAASALVKYATIPLLPLALIYVLTRKAPMVDRIRDALLSVGGVITLTVLAYAPFWRGPSTLNRALLEDSLHLQSFGSMVAWAWPGLPIDEATFFGRVLFVPIYVYACWLATKEPADLLRGCFLAMLGFVGLFIANFKIWYLSWPVVFGALSSNRSRVSIGLAALGASISAALYAYVYLWLGPTAENFNTVNGFAYLAVFSPLLLAAAPWIVSAAKQLDTNRKSPRRVSARRAN